MLNQRCAYVSYVELRRRTRQNKTRLQREKKQLRKYKAMANQTMASQRKANGSEIQMNRCMNRFISERKDY